MEHTRKADPEPMDTLITAGIYLLEGAFLIGLMGSVVVAAITFVEDVQILFSFGGDD